VRHLCSTLLLAGISAMAVPVLAHDINACLPIDDTDMLVCRHYFEGNSVELPVRETLDLIDTKCDQLVVTVLQRQGMMLAELGEPQMFDSEQCTVMTSITIDLPNVRSEADMLVQFSLREGGGVVGATALRVYPDTLLEPLARYAEQHELVVFDEGGLLAEFLEQNDIDYVQRFEAVSENPVALLVQPRQAERLLEARSINTAVIFQEKIVDLPQIRAVSSNGQTRVYVEMPLLHDLHNNPLTQKALLDIIHLASNPIPIDRG